MTAANLDPVLVQTSHGFEAAHDLALSSPCARLAAIDIEAATHRVLTPSQREEVKIICHDLTRHHGIVVGDLGQGPYSLTLGHKERRLVFQVSRAPLSQANTPAPHAAQDCTHENGAPEHAAKTVTLNILVTFLSPYLQDYGRLCTQYHATMASAGHERLEAIDIGRRALHNEAAGVLQARLAAKLTMSLDVARGLFSLIAALTQRELLR